MSITFDLGLVVILGAVGGLVAGSFANVAIARWPHDETVTAPSRSVCPSCGATLAARDLIPVVSWLWLRGRCRYCHRNIGGSYLLVELAMAALFVVASVRFHDNVVVLLAVLVTIWALVVATVIDLRHMIIPNRLTLRLPVVLVALLAIAGVVDGTGQDMVRAIILGVTVPAVMFGLSELFRVVRGQAGMGMGDVKLAISLGLVLGYLSGWHVVVFAYATIIAAGLVALGLVAIGKAQLATRIPFGPYLAVGATVTLLAGDALVAFVRALVGW